MALEELISAIPVWCYLSALAAVLAYWYGTSNHGIFKKMGLPYVKPWPFIGSMHNIFLRPVAEGDLMFLKAYPERVAGGFQGMTPVIECADVEFIKEVTIKHLSNFTNRRNVFEFDDTNILRLQIFALQGDHWKHVRSLITPTFTSGKLKQMYPTINSCADKFVKHLRTTETAPATIKDYAAGFTMDVIASTAFGMDIDAQSQLNHPFIQHAGTFFGIPRKSTIWTKFKQSFTIFAVLTFPNPVLKFLRPLGITFLDQESVDYFTNVVEQMLDSMTHNPEGGKNFISMCTEKMVDHKDVDPSSIRVNDYGKEWSTQGLSRDEITANAVSFFAAGYETTATASQFFFYSMAVFPDVQEQLYEAIAAVTNDGNISYEELQKIDYLDWCVSECLRMFPPILRFDRVAKEDVEIHGVCLPKGQIVNCMTYAVHHNPHYWEEPEKFKPERFSPENKTDLQNYAFLPFGSGGRNCVAMRLALLELKVLIVKSMTVFRFEKVGETLEPNKLQFAKFTGFLQPAEPIKISAAPRKPE